MTELVNSVIVVAVLSYLLTLTSTVSLTAGLFAASLTLRVKLSSVVPKLKLSKLYAFVNVYSFPFLLWYVAPLKDNVLVSTPLPTSVILAINVTVTGVFLDEEYRLTVEGVAVISWITGASYLL